MSLATMIAELRGSIPGYSAGLARTHLREAWTDIRNMKGWSFQLGNSGFGTPGLTEAGSVTVAFGATSVLADAQASAVWATASQPGSLLTQQQFRVGQGTIYNIIAYGGNGLIAFGTVSSPGSGQTPGIYTVPIMDGGAGTGAVASVTVNPDGTVTEAPVILSPGSNYQNPFLNLVAGGVSAQFVISQFGVLTLDRPYYDVTSGSDLGYSIYQCYYPVPVKDFIAWESVVDINNAIDLVIGNAKKNKDWVDANDPQRQIFANPGSILPYQVDARLGSSTFGWMLYELYPQPQSQYAYQTWFSRHGADLVNPQDTLPFPITEHAVKTLARVKAYEWLIVKLQAEHPDRNVSGIQFAMGAAAKQAEAQLKEIRSLDRDRYDAWYSVLSRVKGYGWATTFNPSTGLVSSNNTA